MKRFFCTTCKRIVRVRRLPDDVTSNTNKSITALHSIGTCRHHSTSGSRASVNSRKAVR